MQWVEGPPPGTAGASAIVTAAYTYDGLGDVLTMTMPGPNSTTSTNPSSLPTYVTTTLSYTTDSSYTTSDGTNYPARSQSAALGLPLSVTDPLGHVSHDQYDSRGNTLSVTDANMYSDQYTYNIDDRPLSIVYPKTGQSGTGHGGTLATYLYDVPGDSGGNEQYGPQASMETFDEGDTSGAFRTVSYSYGKEGEALSVSGSTEPVTYTYDALYRVSTLADGNGNTTKYFYNAAGYLYQTAYPLAGAGSSPLATGSNDTITDTGYDADGNVLSRVDGNGTTTAYTYNTPESLLTNVHYTLPSSPPAYISSLADTSYSYDGYGRKATMTDATGSHSYAYDDRNVLTSDTTTYTGLPTKTVSSTYAPDGSKSALTLTGVSGSFSYSYDNAGRMTGLTNPSGETTSWTYQNNNWLASQSQANGVNTTYAYTPKGDMTDLKNAATRGPWAGTTLSEFGGTTTNQMTYDGAGNRNQMASDFPNASGFTGQMSFGWDAKNQLTVEDSTRPSFAYDWDMTFDGAGNRVAANADNQWTALHYDGDGNPETDYYQASANGYDPEGRLTFITNALTCGYAGDGHRAWKGSAAGVRTYFYYDGDLPVLETDASGNVTAVTTQGANGVLSRHTPSGGSVFYAFDPSGSAAQRLDSNGNVLTYAIFTAHGGRFGVNGSTFQSDEPDEYSAPDPFSGFGGQWGYYDDNLTGYELLGHRYYQVALGLFLTRDPSGYDGGINLYNYCQNQPVDNSDPSGFSCQSKYKQCVLDAYHAAQIAMIAAMGACILMTLGKIELSCWPFVENPIALALCAVCVTIANQRACSVGAFAIYTATLVVALSWCHLCPPCSCSPPPSNSKDPADDPSVPEIPENT